MEHDVVAHSLGRLRQQVVRHHTLFTKRLQDDILHRVDPSVPPALRGLESLLYYVVRLMQQMAFILVVFLTKSMSWLIHYCK